MAVARRLALQALRRWRSGDNFANAIRNKSIARIDNATDRAFAQELFYGMLRNLTLLDFWISRLQHQKISDELRDLLRLGLYQLFVLATPPHAAVFETVSLARKSQRGFINGVLRSALRREQDLRAQAEARPLAIRWSQPAWLIERWERQFGEKATAELCAWNNHPAPLYARVNRLRKSVIEFLRDNPRGVLVPGKPDFVQLPNVPASSLATGDCYIQDPSTALAVKLLTPQKGERILDACAAPGGKTSYIAAMADNRAEIVACDREKNRLRILQENLKRLGIERVKIVQHDWSKDAEKNFGAFDKILLDAPCTNTGVIRRRLDVRWRLQPDDFARMQQRQLHIARAVLPLLKKGGTFVYSTCSLEREENEMVVEKLLASSKLRLEKTMTSLPFRDGFDGAFAARLVKD